MTLTAVGLVVAGLLGAALVEWAWDKAQAPPRSEQERRSVAGHEVRIRRGHRLSAEIRIQPRALPSAFELQRAQLAWRALIDSGAELVCTSQTFSAHWKEPPPLELLLEELVRALPLCVTDVLEVSYEVDRTALQELGVGLDRILRGDDLEPILWVEIQGRAALRRRDLKLELRDGRLHAHWKGPLGQKEQVEKMVKDLGEALGRPAVNPWRELDDWLYARRVATRRKAAEIALRAPGPIYDRALPVLMDDPDAELAWEIARTHGRFDAWLAFACDPERPLALRRAAAAHLTLGTASERCRGACLLFEVPELRAQACLTLEGLVGVEVEVAWLQLGRSTQDPELLRRILTGLADTGTPRSLPWLYELQESLGALQFQMRELVEAAQRDIRERSGVVAGALALAEPPPETGALSVAVESGALCVHREEP